MLRHCLVLGIPTIGAFKIVEIDASDIGYGGILKRRISPGSPEQIVRFYFWDLE